MDKKWMPITAGILDILYGAWYAFTGLFTIIKTLTSPWRDLYGVWTSDIIFWAIAFALGALAIVSGAYALKRKIWWLALAGVVIASIIPVGLMVEYWRYWFDPSDLFSLTTLMGFMGIPAIVAIVLTVLSRKQFVG